MKNITHEKGILQVIRRLPSSENGNPRYEVRFNGWMCRTAPDSSYGYSINNMDGKVCDGHIGTYYGQQTIRDIREA